jgi:putative DNA primase/helicase
MSLGPVCGGAVKLGPDAASILVAEGIETALSVMQVTGCVAWAALSTSGIAALKVPTTVNEVIFCVDNDDNGVSQEKASKASTRLFLQGTYARIAVPPLGKDFNDLLREG